MSLWQSVTWDVARAGGFTAYLLVVLSVAVGLALTMHWQTLRWPRIINSELHNFLSLLALVFTGVHVLAVWIDPFTRFGWAEVFLPLVSHYRPLWMAFGIVALYLGIAIGISTWVRPWIGYKWWRRLHILTLLSFLLVTIHGITTGSDTRTWWGVLIYAGSILLVGTLLWLRLIEPANKQSRAHPVFAIGTLLIVLLGVFLTLLGPLQPGWNATANNGNGSGGTTGAAAASSQTQGGNLTPPFSATVQGTMRQSAPDSNGNVMITIQTALSQGATGSLQITLQGQPDGSGSISINTTNVVLGSSAQTPLYSGPLTTLYAGNQWHMTALLIGSGSTSNASSGKLNVRIDLQISNSQQVNGTIQGTSTNATSGNGSSL